MISAWGIEHGLIRKYSRAYGSARPVPDNTTRAKLRPLPDTSKITIKQGKKKLKKPKLEKVAA